MEPKDFTTETIESTTVLEALENILAKAECSALRSEFFEEIEADAQFVKERLDINVIQALAIAMMIDSENSIQLKQMSRFLHCSNLHMQRYRPEFEDLVKRRMIYQVYSSHGSKGYKIEKGLWSAILNNTTYCPKPYSQYTAKDVLTEIAHKLEVCKNERDESKDIYAYTVAAIRNLLNETLHLTMSESICDMELPHEELMMLMVIAVCQLLNHDGNVGPMDWRGIFDDDDDYDPPIVESINNGYNFLVRHGLVEQSCLDGHAIHSYFELTDKAYNEVFCEMHCRKRKHNVTVPKNLLEPSAISRKKLFYNEEESSQVNRLTDLLRRANFRMVQRRMKDAGLRQGFACLFYGAPGTGKTETVLQLAKSTGRSIMQVDMSKLRDKYVGESEKAVQAVFDDYAKAVRTNKTAPILLLNEADAILNKRQEDSRTSVDKMENAIQNIILQAFENLNGILIATTNLCGALDSAFERRFLYKIKFDKPTPKVRTRIWQEMLPQLTAEEAHFLATRFSFSGGQIENVKRRMIVDNILYNTEPKLNAILHLCEEESIKGSSRAIGFAS